MTIRGGRKLPKKIVRKKKKEENKCNSRYTYMSIAVNMNQTMRNNPIAFESSCGLEYAAMTPDPGIRMAE